MANLIGGCLCGDVRYTLSAAPNHAVYCHCGMCRKSSGAPFTGWMVVAAEAVKWTTQEPTGYNSSVQAVRKHCRRCGAQLTWQSNKRPEVIALTIGSLYQPGAVRPGKHIFWADRVAGIELNDGLPRE